MVYGLLLRGINVGKSVRVEMKRLKALLEALGCSDVTTYINSGNVLLSSSRSRQELTSLVMERLEQDTGQRIPTLVKTREELIHIAQSIPESWQNDEEQRTDVAYLFPEADTPELIPSLKLNHDVMDIRYLPGALIWNFRREAATRTRLNKIMGHPLYGALTIRNVNTARVMAGLNKTGPDQEAV